MAINPPIDNKIPETNEQKLQRFLEASGIKQMREDVDAFQLQLQGIISELGNTNQNISKMNTVLEQVVNIINASQGEQTQGATTTPTQPVIGPTANPMDRITMVKELIGGLKELASVYRDVKGSPSPTSFGLDDNWLKEEALGIVKEGLELTHDINRSVKRALTGGTARKAMIDVIQTPHTLE